ncbi:hypothetical protein PSG83_09005 [Enterococcus faecium]|nr:hypothetical protein [Enterococcus faecium]MDV7729823.1 hypothetical protein [Enterococcus faecium]MDV7859434.1 hypothetical protein [Enterococcus faecium]
MEFTDTEEDIRSFIISFKKLMKNLEEEKMQLVKSVMQVIQLIETTDAS